MSGCCRVVLPFEIAGRLRRWEKGSTVFVTRSHIGSVNKGFIFKTLILVVCLCLRGSPAIAAQDPQAVVQTGTEQIIKVLKQHPQDTRARREQIHAVVDRYFDFEAISRLAVGPRWRSLPPEKQQEFTQEFSKLLFNTFVGDIGKYAKQKIDYKLRPIYEGYVAVEAQVNDRGGPVSLEYYLHLKDGNWKVYDVAVAGTSLVTNYRNEFDSILANNSFDHLSKVLRQKIAQVCGLNRC